MFNLITFILIPLIFVNGIPVEKFSKSNNLFTAAVYKEALKNGEENFLISPLSAEFVLALAQSGAKDTTAEEIRTALHLPNSDEETQSYCRNLLQELKNKKDYSLRTANKIYVGKKFPIKNEFKSIAVNSYLSEVENVDFSKTSETINTINEWVEKQTENRIKNIVDASVVNPSTPALFINTLYFKSRWIDNDFYKFPIMQRNFSKNNKDVVQVDMMTHESELFNYLEDSEIGARILELPLQGDAQMVIVLPNNTTLEKVEQKADKIFKNHSFQKEIVQVSMPIFKIESKIDFKKILQELGVQKAFNQNEADFSGIAGNKGDIAVAGVLQKTYIDVNRDGVEAAAATDLWFYLSGPPPPKKYFEVDHPFMFYIKAGDVILFAGRVKSPK